ncbi:MAG: Na+/H+ antiporter subunit E [Hyphomonadaceae bacterium]
MLHAAAMLTGLLLLWLMFAGVPATPEAWLVAGLACVAATALVRLWSGRGFASAAPDGRALLSAMAQARGLGAGVLSTMRAALAADVTLRPALVRIKVRSESEGARAAMARIISATPGRAVVELDGDGLLAHVLQEEAIDAAELGTLEARVGERA